MTKFQKSNMTVDGSVVHLSMPFAKVDKNNRLVSGWATLDNVDTQGDIVLAEASAKAFARARGNIREMHQPLAVGRLVDFEEKEYFYNGEFYRGIYVTARVSEGAEDTWQKVLDGTLAGFSIGGEIIEASNEFVKEAGRTVRFIKEYDLTELSLVDNPANQLANVESFQKSVFSINRSDTGSVIKGMVAETKFENVFACNDDNCDGTIQISVNDTETCPVCERKMENIGWFESGGDRAEKVRSIVAKFRNPADKEDAPISKSEGGVEVGKEEKTETAKEVGVVSPGETDADGNKIEDSDQTSVPLEDAERGADVDETEGDDKKEAAAVAESPEEVTDEATEISKKIDELHEAVKVSLEDSKEETLAKVSELEKKMDENKDEFLARVSDLEKKFDFVGEKIEAQKSRIAALENSLEKYNSSDAFRKSADVEPVAPVVQKSNFWDGAFSD